MNFESVYGAWFVSELNARIKLLNRKRNKNLYCKLYEDVGQKPSFGSDPSEIAVLFAGGNAVRSNAKDVDTNSLPLSVRVLCWQEDRDGVREAINRVQEEFNATPQEFTCPDGLTGETITIRASAAFTTPYVIDEIDYPTERETKKACFLIFSATVSYGATAIVAPPSCRLTVGEEDYDIKHVREYTSVSQPSYDAALPQGEDCARQTVLARTHSYSFTVLRAIGDTLQEVFEKELRRQEGGLFGQKLVLEEGGVKIPIQTYMLTRVVAMGNAVAYTLVLGV